MLHIRYIYGVLFILISHSHIHIIGNRVVILNLRRDYPDDVLNNISENATNKEHSIICMEKNIFYKYDKLFYVYNISQ